MRLVGFLVYQRESEHERVFELPSDSGDSKVEPSHDDSVFAQLRKTSVDLSISLSDFGIIEPIHMIQNRQDDILHNLKNPFVKGVMLLVKRSK
ncbi:MAG: hypothetical protein OXE59_01465 [Bacteroidetes bacterium]|nr:hypothetical protein [Bacteroidota bacterium]